MQLAFDRFSQHQGFIRFLDVDDVHNPSLYIDHTVQFNAGACVSHQIKVGSIVEDFSATVRNRRTRLVAGTALGAQDREDVFGVAEVFLRIFCQSRGGGGPPAAPPARG